MTFKKLNLKKNFILLLTSHLMSGENFLKELNEFISWGKYKLNSGNKWNVLLQKYDEPKRNKLINYLKLHVENDVIIDITEKPITDCKKIFEEFKNWKISQKDVKERKSRGRKKKIEKEDDDGFSKWNKIEWLDKTTIPYPYFFQIEDNEYKLILENEDIFLLKKNGNIHFEFITNKLKEILSKEFNLLLKDSIEDDTDFSISHAVYYDGALDLEDIDISNILL